MQTPAKRPVPDVKPTWTRGLALYLVGVVAISAGAGLLANRLPPLILALALAATLCGLGLATLRWRRQELPDQPRWRQVVPCYLTTVDRQLRIVDSNELFRHDFGDRVGESCFSAYKGTESPCVDCPVQRTFEDGLVHTGEEEVRALDGTVRQVVVTSAPQLDSDGRVVAVTEMATDITEITTLRRELDQTRRDYERLFAAVPCFICVLDREHQIVDCNALYRREFGATHGARCFTVCKQRSEPCLECLVDRTFDDGQVHSGEETLIAEDGRRIQSVVYTRPVRDDNGEITAVMEVFTDITEVKSLQRQLTLMGRAVAGMAHRVKNILMGLDGGIFVVNTGMEDNDWETIAEGWEMVERNVRRVSAIVTDLLYCSKAREPRFEPDVCPHDIVEEVRNLYAQRVVDDDIAIRTEVAEPRHGGLFDPEGLHSLLCNLVANAIDACRFDPDEDKTRHTITLRCSRDSAGATVLEVEDDGAGIPEEHSDRVFEDFFSSKGTEGTGIGLLVVQKVAEEHGGQVGFASRPGKGTRFTVTIPVTAASTPE